AIHRSFPANRMVLKREVEIAIRSPKTNRGVFVRNGRPGPENRRAGWFCLGTGGSISDHRGVARGRRPVLPHADAEIICAELVSELCQGTGCRIDEPSKRERWPAN